MSRPRIPARKKPWSSDGEAQEAVAELCAREFHKVFGVGVPEGWRDAWLQRFHEQSEIEKDARNAAQAFARLSLPTAKARARAVLARCRKKLGYVFPPVASALAQYLASGSSEPFVLDQRTLLAFVPTNLDDVKKFKNAASLQLLSATELLVHTGKKKLVVQGSLRPKRARDGVKWAYGECGALPDITTIDGFVIAKFEELAYDAGPLGWRLRGQPPGKRIFKRLYLTDHELAVLSLLLKPNAVQLSNQDRRERTSASRLLDRARRNIVNKRKVFGYLWTAHPDLTPAKRRVWMKRAMKRPKKKPLVPWPPPLRGVAAAR